MAESKAKLFQEFQPISTSQWEQVIQKDLKGADYNKKLVWRSPDQLEVKPYYRSEDLESLPETGEPGGFPFTRSNNSTDNSWLIRQDIIFTNSKDAIRAVTGLIDKGVQSFGLKTSHPISSDELEKFIIKLPIRSIELNFIGFDPFVVLEVLDSLCRSEGFSPADFSGCLGIDPAAALILAGRLGDEDDSYDQLASVIRGSMQYPGIRVTDLHASYFHNAGSTAVQSVAYTLAVANEYLDELTERELSIEDIAPKFGFTFAVGSNYFFELAKFRSFRSLWSRIIESYGAENLASAKTHIHAETSKWNKTLYDPYVNLLRTTTEAMSSILGGIDSLTVGRFDEVFSEESVFSQRLARNQQLLLREEAYLDKVIDPAAGSYYIESLTDSISGEAWKLFQELEAEGGFVEAFLSGKVQDAITRVAQIRDERVSLRKEVLLGTNLYPNSLEGLKDDVDMSRAHPQIVDPSGADAQPLIMYRGAEGFEKIRLQCEKSEKRPLVFLLPIGDLSMRKARAGFASNFFACAGYEIIDSSGFNDIDEGVVQAIAKHADILVLCSSDEEYAALAPVVLASGFRGELVIAGNPKDSLEELKRSGVKYFIHAKSNVLKTLQQFNNLLGLND